VLTKKSKYGLKAVLVLAEEAGRGPVLVSELADRQRLPKKFLEAILLELSATVFCRARRAEGEVTSSAASRPTSQLDR